MTYLLPGIYMAASRSKRIVKIGGTNLITLVIGPAIAGKIKLPVIEFLIGDIAGTHPTP